MRIRVQFRYDANTGQVELFEVTDAEGGRRAADHDERHDRAAEEIGRLVDPHPYVVEMPGAPGRRPEAEAPRRAAPERDEAGSDVHRQVDRHGSG
jgi:hypothetical protein